MKKINKKSIVLACIAGACILTVGIIAVFILQKDSLMIDTHVYNWVASWQSQTMTQIAKAITMLGSASVLIAIAVLALLGKDRKLGILISLNLIVITVLNSILKWVIQRPRPDEDFRLIMEKGFSFPSRTFYGEYGVLWITYLCGL